MLEIWNSLKHTLPIFQENDIVTLSDSEAVLEFVVVLRSLWIPTDQTSPHRLRVVQLAQLHEQVACNAVMQSNEVRKFSLLVS